ncbi:MAG: class I SAM-dependent methyltransferase [Pseudomonadales bacterium]
MSDKTWMHAQDEEMACWLGVKHKLSSDQYLSIKCAYWEKMLGKIGLTGEHLQSGDILEIGNGPSGLFMLAPDNPQYVCVDPLNDFYQEKFPWVFNAQQVSSTKLEDFRHTTTFRDIFAINCIDHCDDIEAFVASLYELLADDGTVYLAVNTHNYRFIEFIWRNFQSVIEPHHPYQLSASGYARLFEPSFDIMDVLDIEDLIIWVNNETSSEKLGVAGSQPDARNWLSKIDDEIVGKVLVKTLAALGWPQHDFTQRGRSLFRHKLFLMKKRSPVVG